MAGNEEITTVIKFVADKSSADRTVDEMVQRYQAGVSAANARLGGGGGMGGTTTSTAPGGGGLPYNPAYPGPPTPGTPGGGGGGPPPGSSTTSTSGGGGGGPPRGPGGRFVSGGGGPPSLWSDEEIHDMGRVNRVRADMSQYLRGGSLSSTARFLGNGLFSGNPLGGAISALTTGMGDSVMNAAKARAQQIEEAKAMGLSGSQLPTMGMLAYAGPYGIAASLVGQFAARSIDEGLTLQERTSRRYGDMARPLSLAYQTGAIGSGEGPNSFFMRASQARNGGLGPDAALAAASTYAGIGFFDKSPLDYLRLAQTGLSGESIRGFRANARLGVPGLDQGQLEGFIGTGQAAGLAGAGLDALIGQIAANTRTMAMRGVRIDQVDMEKFLNRAVNQGLSPEIAASTAQNMSGNVTSLRDRFLAPFKEYGDALVIQQALRGGGGINGLIGGLEGLAGSPNDIAGIVARGGAVTSAAYGGTGLRNVVNGAVSGRRTARYYGDNFDAYQVSSATARTDAYRFDNMQSPRAYAAQQAGVQGDEAAVMRWGPVVNEMKAAIQDGFSGLNANILGALKQAAAQTDLLMNALQQLLNR